MSAVAGATAVVEGDLWALSWDGIELGCGVVVGVKPSYVLMWPVTIRDDAFLPAIDLAFELHGEGMAVWPTRETGVGTHLLGSKLASVLSARTIALVEHALASGTTPPLELLPADLSDDAYEISDDMIDRWASICHHVWPAPEIGVLRTSEFVERDLTPADVAAYLDLPIPDAVAIWNGEIPPTLAQLAELVERMGVPADALVGIDFETISPALLEPRIKTGIERVAAHLEITEGEARDLVRSEFALAARADGGDRERVDAAIMRLIADGHAR